MTTNWTTAFLWRLQTRKSYWTPVIVTDPALLPSSASCNARLRADEELFRVTMKAVNELRLEWSPPKEPSRSRLDEWFLPGRHQALRQRSSPFLPKVHESSQNRGAPPTHLASVLLLPLLSHRLMALKRKDTRTCLLWMSLWPHISAHPQLSDGRRGRAIRPSCAEPHLHSLDAPTRLPVAQGLRRLSRQLSQCQPPLTPDLLRVGEIEGAHARHNATPSRSAKDPGPRLPWIRRLRSPPYQPGRKGKGAEFSYKQPLMCLSPPRLMLGAEESVFLVPHRPNLAPRCLIAVIADKIKHIFSKREQKSFSAYHKRPALMQPVFTAVSTSCHAGRGLAGHPRCVRVGNDYGKTRLYSPIRSKTTALPRCARHHSALRRRSSPPRRGG